MKETEKYKNIKDLLRDIQLARLKDIISYVLAETTYTRKQISGKNSDHEVVDIRRKIAYVARLKWNIAGTVIAKFLNVKTELISTYIHTAHARCKVDKPYQKAIYTIIDKLN